MPLAGSDCSTASTPSIKDIVRPLHSGGDFSGYIRLSTTTHSLAYVPDTASNDYAKSLTPQDMKQLRTWGLNVLRLGVMWPGVEPVEGQCVRRGMNPFVGFA